MFLIVCQFLPQRLDHGIPILESTVKLLELSVLLGEHTLPVVDRQIAGSASYNAFIASACSVIR